MFLSNIVRSIVLHLSLILYLSSSLSHSSPSFLTPHTPSIYPSLPPSPSPFSPSISSLRWLVPYDCVRSSSPYLDVPHHYSIHFPTRCILQQSDQLRCHHSSPPWLLRHVHTRYSSKLCSFSQVCALPC